MFGLHQAQLTGTRDRFGTPLDLELGKDFLIVPLYRVQGEEESPADLAIREALSDQTQDFYLAFT